MSNKKVQTSSLCWIPPVEQQESIQEMRKQHDPQIDRWPPHINLLYPFLPETEFEAAAARLAAALCDELPFQCQLRRIDRFEHGKKSFTAWLAPEGADEQWQQLHSVVRSIFPHCTDMSDHPSGFVPHLTVGEFKAAAQVDTLKRTWTPLTVLIGELALISRDGQHEPFIVRWRVPLGGGPAVRAAPPAAAVAAAVAADPSASVRITLAANSNRSVRSPVLASAQADLGALLKLANNKLRLKAKAENAAFFREGGAPLGGGERLTAGELLLVSKGEPYVGAAGDKAAAPAVLPSLEPTDSGGYPRRWLPAEPPAEVEASDSLRLMTWNLLASVLCHGAATPADEAAAAAAAAAAGAPPAGWVGVRSWGAARRETYTFRCAHAALAWPLRAPLIVRELLGPAPALLCLQEVDAAALAWLRVLLGARGFDGVAAKELGAGGNHGVALFWQTAKVRAVDRPLLGTLATGGDKYVLLQRLALTDGTGRELVLGTTHLKAGSSTPFEEQRATQAQVLLEVLAQYCSGASGRSSAAAEAAPASEGASKGAAAAAAAEAVVLAGDLNAHPRALEEGSDGRRLEPRALPLLHERGGFRCAHREALGAPPPFTYWAGWESRDVKAAFDHVLLRGELAATAALVLPDEALVAASPCRLPNADFPSDHLPLVVQLRLGAAGGREDMDRGASVPAEVEPAPAP